MLIKRISFFLLFLIAVIPALAQWNYDPLQNTPVDTGQNKTVGWQSMTNDGNGGYFIVWMKYKPAVYCSEIYAQHIDANGVKLWAQTGILICNAVNCQFWPKVVTDGTGGAIIVWQDERTAFGNNDIYAQRITATGNLLWAANGIPVFNTFFNEMDPQIISDGNGGCIITGWQSSSGGNVTDIFAQRINGSGAKLWGTNGVIVCNAPNRQDYVRMISDGNNGAILTWMDFRNSPTNNVTDIYAQHIDVNGNSLWAANGIAICTMPSDQSEVQLVPDKNNGAYITWSDFRNSTPGNNVLDIYAQHVNSTGTALWAPNGIPVCSAPDIQQSPNLIAADNGDVMIAWFDNRSASRSVYLQRLSPAGNPLFTVNGIPVCTNATLLLEIIPTMMVTDNANGCIIAWKDKRSGPDENIYAQHVDAGGAIIWAVNGIPVCNDPKQQYFIKLGQPESLNGCIASDGVGGAVIVWDDERNLAPGNSFVDMYMSRISDAPKSQPLVINVNNKCQGSPTAKAKLLNPPAAAAIEIKQDGITLPYDPADSSFLYFITGATPAGNHSINIKYSNFAGFTQKDTTYNVTTAITPGVSISGITTVQQGQSTTLTALPVTPGTSPAWQWQDSTSNHGWANIAGAATALLTYTPLLTNTKIRCLFTSTDNCANQNTVTSNVLNLTLLPVTNPAPGVNVAYFAIPAAFTPDGNGTNDILAVKSIGYIDLVYFRIYNKWSELVFETRTMNDGWNGVYKGKLQSTGTYIWVAKGSDIRGKVITDKGSFVLIR